MTRPDCLTSGGHWPLIRRQITTDRITGGLAFYRCAGPSPTPVAKLGARGRDPLGDGGMFPDRQGRSSPGARFTSMTRLDSTAIG
ncbi:MAG TPA: hypothetical protein VGO16_03875 [Pseudonocardiaceae bacterium]|nr:hypothetical protein [Pseudonocardiaceae bacterium]